MRERHKTLEAGTPGEIDRLVWEHTERIEKEMGRVFAVQTHVNVINNELLYTYVIFYKRLDDIDDAKPMPAEIKKEQWGTCECGGRWKFSHFKHCPKCKTSDISKVKPD